MSHYLVEFYTPKPAWAALDAAGRADFFETIGAGMGALSELGVEPVTLSEIASDVIHAPAQQFLAVWRCPDRASVDALVDGIAASGWHDYFETVNAVGAAGDLEAHLGQLAQV